VAKKKITLTELGKARVSLMAEGVTSEQLQAEHKVSRVLSQQVYVIQVNGKSVPLLEHDFEEVEDQE
jgi:hypothetical protein